MSVFERPDRAVGFFFLLILPVALSPLGLAANRDPKSALPEEVDRSVRVLFPTAKVEEFKHTRRVIRLIEVTVIENGQEHDVILTPDGTMLAVEDEIDPSRLPSVVHDAARDAAGGEKIIEADRITVLAEIRPVALEQPRTEYAATYRKNRKEQELVLSEEGSVLQTTRKMQIEEKK